MSELGDVFAILQQLDHATLFRVKVEVDRMMRERESERRGCVEGAAPASVVRSCA
jgi:hypothetical protein